MAGVNVTAQNPIPQPSGRLATISKCAVFGQWAEGYDNNDLPIWRPGLDNLGSAEKCELKLSPKKAQAKNHAAGISLPMATAVTGLDATMSLTLTQKSPLVKALEILAADPSRRYTQGAQASAKKALGKAIAGLTYPIGYKNVKVTAVALGTDAADPTAVAVTDFRVDRRAGWIWIGTIPAGASDGDQVIVTFTAQEITETENLIKFGGMTGAGFRMRLFIQGRGITGLQTDMTIWDAQFITDSTISKSNTSDNFDQVELQADLFPALYDNFGNLLDPDDAYFVETGISKAPLIA